MPRGMKGTKGAEMIPAKPFSDWLDQRYRFFEEHPGLCGHRGPAEMLLAEIGWGASEAGVRRLYRYRHQRSETRRGRQGGKRGKSMVLAATEYPRDIVEEALHHAGVLFEDVYPEIAAAEDTVLEPEAWCPHCQDIVTPIDGVCPWDGWRLSAPTGQKLFGRVLKAAA